MRAWVGLAFTVVAACSGGHPTDPSSITDDDGDADLTTTDPNDPLDIDSTDQDGGDGATFLHVICAGDSLSGSAAYRGAIAGDLASAGRSVDMNELSQTGASSAVAIALQTRLEAIGAPDVGIIWTGLDDAIAGVDAATTLQAVSDMVGYLRERNPDVLVLVAEVPGASDPDIDGRIATFDSALAGLVSGLTTSDSVSVEVLDRDGFDPTQETDDGEHPNDAGSRAVGHAVAAALLQRTR